MMYRIIKLGLIVICVICVNQGVAYAKGGFPDLLPKMFPSIFKDKSDEGPDPSETLQAPFINPDEKNLGDDNALGIPYQGYHEDDKLLSKPHRSGEQVEKWLTNSLSEILTFNHTNYNERRKVYFGYMSREGFIEYETFLKNANLLGALKAKNMTLQTYVDSSSEKVSKGLIIHEGPVAGRYRWMFRVPVVMNFLPIDTVNYDDDKTIDSKKFYIIMQVGRVKGTNPEDDGDGLQIETWEVKPRKR